MSREEHLEELRARAAAYRQRRAEVAEILMQERLIVINGAGRRDTFLMLHPSTVIPGGWQVSYFDRSGPYGHEDGDDMEAVVLRALEGRDLTSVKPVSERAFMRVTASKEFREGVDRVTYTGLMNKMTYEFGYDASEEYLRDAQDAATVLEGIDILRAGLRTLRRRRAPR